MSQQINEVSLQDGVQHICFICGGKLVLIHARIPGYEGRLVCPTCAVETLDEILSLINRIRSKPSKL